MSKTCAYWQWEEITFIYTLNPSISPTTADIEKNEATLSIYFDFVQIHHTPSWQPQHSALICAGCIPNPLQSTFALICTPPWLICLSFPLSFCAGLGRLTCQWRVKFLVASLCPLTAPASGWWDSSGPGTTQLLRPFLSMVTRDNSRPLLFPRSLSRDSAADSMPHKHIALLTLLARLTH